MSDLSCYEIPTYPQTRTKKKRKIRKKLLLILACAILLAILLFFYLQRNVTRVLISISEATMRASTTVAVNDAVFYTLSDKMQYEDLVTITRDEQGEIVAVSANALKINKIARDTASISQSNLKNLSLNGIPIP